MRGRIIDDTQSVRERADDLRPDGDATELVELRFRVDRLRQYCEAVAELVAAEVVEVRLADGLLDQRVGVHQSSDRSTTLRPMVRRCAWSSRVAATCDIPMRRPTTGRIFAAATSSHSAA